MSIIIRVSCFMLFAGFSIATTANAQDEDFNREEGENPAGRLQWFFEQRAFPFDTMKQGYLLNAHRLAASYSKNRTPDQAAPFAWTPIGPAPGGANSGRIPAIAVHPGDGNTVYVGAADGGVWKSTNGGTSWTALTDGAPSLASGCVAIDPVNPDVIYWGTGEPYSSQDAYGGVGVLKSVDAGATWSVVGLTNEKRITRIAINPANPDIVLAATWGGIYRSSNGGTTWTKTSSFSSGWDVAIDPSNPLVCYAGASGVYKSTNGGTSWFQLANGAPSSSGRLVLSIAHSAPSTIYVLVSNTTFFKSTDAGASWTSRPIPADLFGSQGWYDIAVGASPTNPDLVLIGGIAPYFSSNGGNSWTQITGGQHPDCHAFAFGPGVVYMGNDGGVTRSTDNGVTFTRVNNNLAITQFYTLATSNINPSEIWGGTQDNGTLSTTGSLAWTTRIIGDGGVPNIDDRIPAMVYAELQNGHHYRTTNSGNYWYDANVGITEGGAWVTPVVLHPDTTGIVYTATSKIYRTRDSAKSWQVTAPSFPWGGSLIRQLAIPKTTPQTLYASPGATVYKSTNAGATWTNVSTGLPGRTVTSIVPHRVNASHVYLTVSGSGTGHIYSSVDSGNTWSSINGNFPTDLPANSIAIDPSNESSLYIGTDLGIWSTADGGVNWFKDDGFPNSAVVMLGISSDNFLIAATHGRSMFKTALSAGLFVALLSPNGGESWSIGTIHNILWSQSGITNVKLEFSSNGGGSWSTISPGTPASTGSYAWTLPGTTTSQGLVRISDASNASISDVSNGAFSITSGSVITLTAPNGGESWAAATSHNITWTSSLIANVKLEYSTNNGGSWLTVTNSTPAAPSSYSWLVPNTPSGQALVRISDASNAALNDSSNAPFAITPPPSITLTSPNGGESWDVLSSHSITWGSVSVSFAKLEYSTNNGSNWNLITASTSAPAGSYPWTVPNTPTSQGLIRISDASNAAVRDSSNGVFTIVAAPAVSVISPNGGETWNTGSLQSITWAWSNITNLRIEYSTDSGTSWLSVIAGTPASAGSYSWSVPNTPTTHARVRISDAANASTNDISNSAFTISAPAGVIVTSPNGGENWLASTVHNITWSSSGVTNVKIKYSTNNGASWSTVSSSTPASAGSYAWTVPNTPTTQARVQISNPNGSITDASDSTFTISSGASVTVTAPNGGENWTVGSTQNIAWSAAGISSVNIEYSTDAGTTWNAVASGITASAGSYAWMIPNALTSVGLVRLSDASNPSVNDQSNAVFTISEPPDITIVAPNGGEILLAGNATTISWTSTSIPDVRLEYSTDNGSTWLLIEASVPALPAAYSWIIPNTPSAAGLVRASDASAFIPSDQSDAPFAITRIRFLTSLICSDNGAASDTLFFGAAGAATNGLDSVFGEVELSPKPSPGTFDARWEIAGTNGLGTDIRDTLSPSFAQAVYTCELQAGSGGYPFHLAWGSLGKGIWTLQDAVSHGGHFNVRMHSDGTFTVTDPSIASVELIYDMGEIRTVAVHASWNMLSLPVEVTNNSVNENFQGAISSAFSFTQGGYQKYDSLAFGGGYWLKFPADNICEITGEPVTDDTLDLITGWNMIGSLSEAVSSGSLFTIPPGIMSSPLFGFERGVYSIADSIHAGSGYWIKTNQPGRLVISSVYGRNFPAGAADAAQPWRALNSLTVRNSEGREQTLYFGEGEESLAASAELPQLPPADVFDVRFASQKIAEVYSPDGRGRRSLPIAIQTSAYPLTVSWNIRNMTRTKYTLTDGPDGSDLCLAVLPERGSCQIRDPRISTLFLQIQTGEKLPAAFKLWQNYPNPFNPSTTIQFDLPEPGVVTLRVYDLLGREMMEILDHRPFGAGTHVAELDATKLASGIYFYQISGAGEHAHFADRKKMLLVR